MEKNTTSHPLVSQIQEAKPELSLTTKEKTRLVTAVTDTQHAVHIPFVSTRRNSPLALGVARIESCEEADGSVVGNHTYAENDRLTCVRLKFVHSSPISNG